MIQYESLTHGGTVCCGARPRWHCYNPPSVILQTHSLNTPEDGNESIYVQTMEGVSDLF